MTNLNQRGIIVVMSDISEPIAYLNGDFIPVSQAKLSVFDQGVVQGASVTEMIRTFKHQPFRLDDHLNRLQQSIRCVGFDPDESKADLYSIASKIVEQNAQLISPSHDLGLTIFVTPGDNPTYKGGAVTSPLQTSTVCAHTFPLPFEIWAGAFETGQHLITPSLRHIPPESLDARIKTRSRLNWYLADREAQLADPKARALVLDGNGNVTETSTANFLIASQGRIIAPDPTKTLSGVSLFVVSELVGRLGLEFTRADLKVYDVLTAEEAFTSSTPYCLLPVTRVNGKPIGDGTPGPVFLRIMAAWNDLVGVDIISQMTDSARERLSGHSVSS
jgi:branched-chain amino acid aminotransferase